MELGNWAAYIYVGLFLLAMAEKQTYRYYININQRALVENGLIDSLNLADLIVFDFMHYWIKSDIENKVTFKADGVVYCEIRTRLIQDNLPILKSNSRRTIANIINNLINAGLIIRYENNQTENRCGYAAGERFDILDTPVQNLADPCAKSCIPPVQNLADKEYINIRDNNLRDNTTYKAGENLEYNRMFDYLTQQYDAYKIIYNPVVARNEWQKLTDGEKRKAVIELDNYINSNDKQFIKHLENYLKTKEFFVKHIKQQSPNGQNYSKTTTGWQQPKQQSRFTTEADKRRAEREAFKKQLLGVLQQPNANEV